MVTSSYEWSILERDINNSHKYKRYSIKFSLDGMCIKCKFVWWTIYYFSHKWNDVKYFLWKYNNNIHISVPSNMSVSLFRVHLDHSDTCPFIAIYTPGVESVERTPRAKPTLKSASVDLKVSGRKAPVSTMVLSVTRRDRKAAVSSMVSVPCVIRIRFERVSQQVFANFSLKRKNPC